MTQTLTADQRIVDEVTAWPGMAVRSRQSR